MSYDSKTHCTEHFSWAEMDPEGLAGEGARLCLHRLCNDVLEPLRARFGKPVHVTSGYRDRTVQARIWNEAVRKYGGPAEAEKYVAPPGHSQHELGTAADLWIEDVTLTAIADHLSTNPVVGGIGIYRIDGFVHVDIRPREGGVIARW